MNYDLPSLTCILWMQAVCVCPSGLLESQQWTLPSALFSPGRGNLEFLIIEEKKFLKLVDSVISGKMLKKTHEKS